MHITTEKFRKVVNDQGNLDLEKITQILPQGKEGHSLREKKCDLGTGNTREPAIVVQV